MSFSSAARFSVVLALLGAFAVVQCAEGPYTYNRNGDDWEGTCATGKAQSPVNIVTTDFNYYDGHKSVVDLKDLGEVEGITVFSHGPTVEVQWKKFTRKASIMVAAPGKDIYAPFHLHRAHKFTSKGRKSYLEIEPLQFHFHTPSENMMNGRMSPATVHIVHAVKKGQSKACDESTCLVVLDVHFDFAPDPTTENRVLARLLAKPPMTVGKENGVEIKGTLDLNTLLPTNTEHFTWIGSLTTPPCTEGVVWVLFTHTVPISTAQVAAFQMVSAFSAGPDCAKIKNGLCDPPRQKTNSRVVQPLNDRIIRRSYA